MGPHVSKLDLVGSKAKSILGTQASLSWKETLSKAGSKADRVPGSLWQVVPDRTSAWVSLACSGDSWVKQAHPLSALRAAPQGHALSYPSCSGCPQEGFTVLFP